MQLIPTTKITLQFTEFVVGLQIKKYKGMEKILRIDDTDFTVKDGWGGYEGFQIITDQQTIKVGISSGQCCCESYGCIITNDDIKDFVGAELVSVSLTDLALNNKKIDELEYLDSGGAMFVNIETNVGVLQLVAYNAHNGYYGHEAVLISKQLNETQSL